MEPTPPLCPFCSSQAHLSTRESRYRRGARVVSVQTQHWECPADCEGPDGARPFRFQDPALLRSNDERAEVAWREKFGQEMPASGRPGRKTAARRLAPIQVRLTPSERDELDRQRGALPVSAYVRSLLHPTVSSRAPRFPLVDTEGPQGPRRRPLPCT